MNSDEIAKALKADVVIPLGRKGLVLSIAESLSLRHWWDKRRTATPARTAMVKATAMTVSASSEQAPVE